MYSNLHFYYDFEYQKQNNDLLYFAKATNSDFRTATLMFLCSLSSKRIPLKNINRSCLHLTMFKVIKLVYLPTRKSKKSSTKRIPAIIQISETRISLTGCRELRSMSIP